MERTIRLPIGRTDFREIREGSCYYIDKTENIGRIIRDGAKSILFTRPRRFGKTTFQSMLRAFFDIREDSRDIFSGLAVMNDKEAAESWMNKCPVVFLTFKNIDGLSFDSAFSKLRWDVMELFQTYSFLDDGGLGGDESAFRSILSGKASIDEISQSFYILAKLLYSHYSRKVIFIIDEYDVPVAEAEENGYYDEMIDFFKEFFSNGLKTNEYLKMAVLTGCLRIVRESVFTGLNNLTCYGVSDEKFSDIFGFTQTEVDTLLTEAGLAQRKEEVKNWYDGYCFGDTQEVYCPWSIMRYIDDAQGKPNTRPKAYWLHTSANALLQRLIDGSTSDLTDVIDTLLEGGSFVAKLNLCPTYGQLSATPENIWSLLYQTGYLTRIPKGMPDKSLLPESDLELLAIPNREIAWLFREELEHWFSKQVTASQRNGLCTAFWKPDAELFAKLLSETLLVSISMYDYKEHFYHGMLAGIFISTAAQTFSNLETGEGRSDILVIDNRKAAVIEVKRTTRVQDLPALVEEGMQQIAAKQYDTRVKAIPMVRTILHWSIAFCKKTCLAKARIVRHEE